MRIPVRLSGAPERPAATAPAAAQPCVWARAEPLRPLEQKAGKVWRTTQYITGAPITPASVTIAEMVPMSATQPALMRTVRLAAIGRKKAFGKRA